jgi:hypothetical protein
MEVQTDQLAEPQNNQEKLIPLDAPERVSSFRIRGHVYRHIFRRITSKDWDGFFTRFEAEVEQQGRDTVQMVTTSVATLWLYAAAIVRVEGYLVDGDKKVEELPNWIERIPQDHRLLAVDALTRVTAKDSEEQVTLRPNGELVTLDAMWSEEDATDATPAGMTKYSGLIHRFDTPTDEQRGRFIRARSRAVVVGGAHKGKTRLASAQPVLVKLYDELIQSVEGYSLGDTPISGRETIAREMDGLHKVTAVGQLFPTDSRNEAE